MAAAYGRARRPTREIVWREVRRSTDPQGGTHVVYRQSVAGAGLDAELVGSDVGVHRLPGGTLIGVSGTQFDSVILAGCPQISAAMAVEVARERVLLYKGEYVPHGAARRWTMDAQGAARLAQTKLRLVQLDGTFGPAWFTVSR